MVRTQTTRPPRVAQRFGQPVDVRDDLARLRDFDLLTRRHEVILHIDHDEGGLVGGHVVMDIPAALPLEDAGDDLLRNMDLVQMVASLSGKLGLAARPVHFFHEPV